MNIPGTNSPRLVIGDADGLIALLFDDDVNHPLALQAAQKLVAQQADVLFPLTAIVGVIVRTVRICLQILHPYGDRPVPADRA